MSDSFTRALNMLTHLDYHWLWGIRYHKTPKPVNIGTTANDLLKNNEMLTNLVQKQQNVYQQPALIRFFYWLFNFDNYAYNAYLLAACNILAENNNPMFAKLSSANTPLYGGLKWAQETLLRAGQKAVSSFEPYLLPMQKNDAPTDSQPMQYGLIDMGLHQESQNSLADEKHDALPISSHEDAIAVKEFMLPHLIILGFDLNVGDSLTHDVFKSACRSKYLESHPDKPGGSKEAFLLVKQAVEKLTKIIFSRQNSKDINILENNPDEYWSDFYARADEIRVELEQIAAEQKQIGADFKQIGADFKQIGADFKQIGADLKQIGADLKQIGADLKQIGADFKQIGAEQKQIQLAIDRIEAEKEKINNIVTENRQITYAQYQELIADLIKQQLSSVVPSTSITSGHGFFASENEQEDKNQPGTSPKAN